MCSGGDFGLRIADFGFEEPGNFGLRIWDCGFEEQKPTELLPPCTVADLSYTHAAVPRLFNPQSEIRNPQFRSFVILTPSHPPLQ